MSSLCKEGDAGTDRGGCPAHSYMKKKMKMKNQDKDQDKDEKLRYR